MFKRRKIFFLQYLLAIGIVYGSLFSVKYFIYYFFHILILYLFYGLKHNVYINMH